MMFTGSYVGNADDKGRVIIPVRLRLSLGERVWVCKGVDGCLNIFTQDAWHDYTNSYISNRTLKDEKARQLQRFVFGGSHELDVDRQGRINLPQELLEFAGIKKDVVFAGVGSFVELWSSEAHGKETGAGDLKALMSEAVEIGKTTDEG